MDLAPPAPDRVCPACQSRFPAGANYCPHDGQRLEDILTAPAPQDPLIDTLIDERYRLSARLGQGGMGVVYAARHAVIDKQVAVKVLREEYCRDPGMVERFMREARAASLIGHPNIVDVTDFGRTADGHVYFVMEFLIGTTLSKELRTCGALPTWRAVDIAQQICQGLFNAHSKGIVHRDLKPENVFIVNPCKDRGISSYVPGERLDFIKLLDFGIAKITWGPGARLTKAGSIFGTPQYMCPEQAKGRDADHRGDIYSLGCILYEMITGTVPFLAETFMGTLSKHMFEAPEPPGERRPDLGIPDGIQGAILRAMAKDPSARFQTMAEMAETLATCTGDADAARKSRGAAERLASAPSIASSAAAVPAPESHGAAAEPGMPATIPQGLRAARPQVDSHHGSPTLPSGPGPAAGSEERIDRRPRFSSSTDDVRLLDHRKSKLTHWLIGGIALVVVGGAAAVLPFRSNKSELRGPLDLAQDATTATHDRDASPPRSDAGAVTAAEQDTAGGAEDGGDGRSAQRRAVAVSLTTIPSGAEVSRAGKSLGRTPLMLQLPPGQLVSLSFYKRGFRRLPYAFTVDERDHKIVLSLIPRSRRPPAPDAGTSTLKVEDLRKPSAPLWR